MELFDMKTCVQCGKEFKPLRSEKTCSIVCGEKYEQYISDIYDANNKKFGEIVNDIPNPNYSVDFNMHRLKPQFMSYAKDYGSFEYNPDFQRGHVWSIDKQIAFIEAIVENTIAKSLLTITLNCPEFDDFYKGEGDLTGFCIIDGLQRVTAIQDFVEGKFKIYNNQFGYDDFDLSKYSFKRVCIRVQVFTFKWKKDLLKYYIAINSGGVVHSDEEIERVKGMLAQLP